MHAAKLMKCPRTLRGRAAFDLVEDVARWWCADLDHEVVVPVAIDTNVLGGIVEQRQRSPGGALVLELVPLRRLGAGAFAWFDFAETHHAMQFPFVPLYRENRALGRLS